MSRWWLLIPGLLLLLALLYWQIIVAEGAYLGRRLVALLYDLSASLYDRIKGYEDEYEAWFLGQPLARALALVPDPLVLDVATGTGRLPLTLFRDGHYRGRLIGLDYACRMVRLAARKLAPWRERITWLCRDATTLPFSDATFNAVTCLEALEFFPHPKRTLREMVRVLRPGGLLLITNRIGRDAALLPGRAFDPMAFEALLQGMGLEMVKTKPWEEDYDLIWARKRGIGGPVGMRRLEDILRCPRCGGRLHREEGRWACERGHRFPLQPGGILDLR